MGRTLPLSVLDNPSVEWQNDWLMENDSVQSDVSALRVQLFRKSPLRRQLLARLERMWDGKPEASVVDVTSDEVLALSLRQKTPDTAWTALAVLPEQEAMLKQAGITESLLFTPPDIPLENGCTDAVIASDVLEYVENPTALVAEFHRILRPKTRLILHVQRKRKSLLPLFRTWAGLADPLRPRLHSGFTPEDIFDALKDGFDVQEEVGFGKFFTELAEMLAELFAGIIPGTCETASMDERRLRRAILMFTLFTPFFWVSAVLDALLFFLPTHHVVLRARRRMLWVPRMTPRLKDGRSIAEAALGSKIGTATDA